MADALDSKSSNRKIVRVQVPPPVLLPPLKSASGVAFEQAVSRRNPLWPDLGLRTVGQSPAPCVFKGYPFSSGQSALLQRVPICDAIRRRWFVFEPQASSETTVLDERVNQAGGGVRSAAVGLATCIC